MEYAFITLYKNKRFDFFKWRCEAHILYKLIIVFLFTCLTALGASFFRFYLPFTPVPITLQVFFVLLAGIVLGKWYGGLAQLFYVGFGVVGIPWFTTASALTGVTGGYLIGFIFAALFIGWCADRYISMRDVRGMLLLMFLAVGIIYAFGAIQFSVVMGTNIRETMTLAVLPFVLGDLVKAFFAASAGYFILPKTAY
jgi:biotin transport system substrate-specific component